MLNFWVIKFAKIKILRIIVNLQYHRLLSSLFGFYSRKNQKNIGQPRKNAINILLKIEPPHDKTNEMTYAPSKDSDQVWSESSLSAWRNHGSLATHKAHSEDSDQTGQMPRLTWVFAGRTGHFIGFVMLWLKFEQCGFIIA